MSGSLSRRTVRSESSQAGRLSLTWIYWQLSFLSAGRCGPTPLVQCHCARGPPAVTRFCQVLLGLSFSSGALQVSFARVLEAQPGTATGSRTF